ncbi:hypothetical protein LSUCC0031_11165 [Rhodobacterales bacterium LSUCC0031]|nr:hypothetical protein [Rhodobacterales bacterium LSUCC0031]
MIRAAQIAGLVALPPTAAMAEAWPMAEVIAPSGQAMILHEWLDEQDPWSGERQIIIRLLAPMIGVGGVDDAALRMDMAWACDLWGKPIATRADAADNTIVIEVMSAPTPRGTPTPEINRYYETYRITGDACIWELF